MFQEFTWNSIELEATDLIVEGETEQEPATRSMLELRKPTAGEFLHFDEFLAPKH